MAYDIAGAVKEFFGFFRAREENVSAKHLQRIINRQEKAIDAAEGYINADEDLKGVEEPNQIRQLSKIKNRQKARFRKYN